MSTLFCCSFRSPPQQEDIPLQRQTGMLLTEQPQSISQQGAELNTDRRGTERLIHSLGLAEASRRAMEDIHSIGLSTASEREKYQVFLGESIGPIKLNMPREQLYKILSVDQPPKPTDSYVETFGNGGLTITYDETFQTVVSIQVDPFWMDASLYLEYLNVFSCSFNQLVEYIRRKDPNAVIDALNGTVRSESLGAQIYTNKSEATPPSFLTIFNPKKGDHDK